MKILKLIKNNIIGFVLGGIIIGSVTAGAATLFASSDVVYDNTNSGASATNVKDALDELYELTNSYKFPDWYYEGGNAIYFNPISGEICDDYVSDNSLNENIGATTDTECMKWYIIGEDTDTLDMILDHNTTYKVAWNSSESNGSGPAELLTELNNDTSGWTGVPARTDTYTDPAYGYTIDYSGYRARLIEANELAELTGADKALEWDSAKGLIFDSPTIGTNVSWYYLDGKYGTDSTWQSQVATLQGASKYAWLFDYTFDCTSEGCNIIDNSYLTEGYWTSSAVAGYPIFAWFVRYNGYVNCGDVYDDSYGIRPVITIPKF